MQFLNKTWLLDWQNESLRISTEVLFILETKRMAMHADDYQYAALHLIARLRQLAVADLLRIARSHHAVLFEAAESVLVERGADNLIDDSAARQFAIGETLRLLRRL